MTTAVAVRKVVSNIPVKVKTKQVSQNALTIPLTFDEHLAVKIPPHISMIEMQEGRGTSTDWFNTCYRIVCGLRIVEMCYMQSTVEEYKPGFDSIQKVRENYLQTGKWEFTSKEDIDNVSSCLRSVDDMQDQINRETLLFCFKKARTFVTKYIKE